MPVTLDTQTAFIVLSVALFVLVGVCLVVIVDHKARIPGPPRSDPFTISGLRRDHPVIGFLTAVILLGVISVLMLELGVTVGEKLGLLGEAEKPELLHQLREVRFTERMRHFHNEPATNRVDLGRKQACFYCHGDYPHSKQRMVRTLLNMHTQFVGCMTCHTDPEKIPEARYRFAWRNFSGIEVTGPPYGTSINPETGWLVDTDDVYSKIVVFAPVGGREELLELTEDNREVREFAELASKKALSDQDFEAVKIRFHSRIMRKGRFCSRCHVAEDESYLPFRQLGFSEQRIRDLTSLNIVGIVEKYRRFYLPKLFQTPPPAPSAGAGGPEHNARSQGPERPDGGPSAGAGGAVGEEAPR